MKSCSQTRFMCVQGQSVGLVEATLPKQGNAMLYFHFTEASKMVVVGTSKVIFCFFLRNSNKVHSTHCSEPIVKVDKLT